MNDDWWVREGYSAFWDGASVGPVQLFSQFETSGKHSVQQVFVLYHGVGINLEGFLKLPREILNLQISVADVGEVLFERVTAARGRFWRHVEQFGHFRFLGEELWSANVERLNNAVDTGLGDAVEVHVAEVVNQDVEAEPEVWEVSEMLDADVAGEHSDIHLDENLNYW